MPKHLYKISDFRGRYGKYIFTKRELLRRWLAGEAEGGDLIFRMAEGGDRALPYHA